MKLHEKIAIKLCQVLPESLIPDSLNKYCITIAERELEAKKRDLIRKNWERSKLECQLQKLKRTNETARATTP